MKKGRQYEEIYLPRGESIVGKANLSTWELGPVSIPLSELAAAYTHVLKHGLEDLWDMLFTDLDNPVTVPAAKPEESREAW